MKTRNSIVGTLAVILSCLFSNVLCAEERLYGSFIYNSKFPNALFFMDKIKDGDDFELRKALRNHDVDTIVLASPGGSVWAGLSMAGIIFDKKLRVFVPSEAVCASACSFMFFGGAERLSEGALGVHQFAYGDTKKSANAVKTQAQSQFTVSEIIGFLNEFDTPRFVLERMFEDREMYWFNSEEITQLNSTEFTIQPKIQSAISGYASGKRNGVNGIKAASSEYSVKELITLIQRRLNEIGCSAGSPDGVWGRQTYAAAVAFARKSGLPTSGDDLISVTFLDALDNARGSVCSSVIESGPEKFASFYEYSCNGGPVFNDVWSIARHDKPNKVVYLRTAKGDTQELNYTDKRFTTSEGMDGKFFLTDEGYVYKFSYGSRDCSEVTFQPKN